MSTKLLPPIHPGEILKDELDERGITPHRLALDLHIPPSRIDEIVKGKRGITADTALRLGRYFGMNAEFWINLQGKYDLKVARREKLREIEREVVVLEA